MMGRNSYLLYASLFLLLTLASFVSMRFHVVSAHKQKLAIEQQFDQALEKEVLQREQDWVDMEMARFEKARGFLPVRPMSSSGERRRLTETTPHNIFERAPALFVAEQEEEVSDYSYSSASNLRGPRPTETPKTAITLN